MTWRTYPPSNPYWKGGPVLALWPDQKFLGKLHDDVKVNALCDVPGSMDDVRLRVTASKAVDLRSGAAAAGPPALNPVVEQAMLSLTSSLNHGNRLLGSYDKAEAITALQVLHRGRYRLDLEHLEAWALAQDWPAEKAGRFREFAEGVISGHRYKVATCGWRDDILDYWKKRASGEITDP